MVDYITYKKIDEEGKAFKTQLEECVYNGNKFTEYLINKEEAINKKT